MFINFEIGWINGGCFSILNFLALNMLIYNTYNKRNSTLELE